MKRIFEEEARVQRLLDVEAALAWAHGEVGDIPKRDAQKIVAMASLKHIKLERVKEIECETKHDIASLVRALADASGSSGAYVHLGATSYDIVDTATAMQLKEAIALIENRLDCFEETLINKASLYKSTMMMGRTHGQHALPITLGFKFAVWMREISRHIQRLEQCRERVLVGKMSGAVGTQAALGENAQKVQELVMKRLEIKSADISTQIVQRDRLAELLCLFGVIATSLENFATEIRELQRTEIGELFESFEVKKQVGSSAMAHKQNPETCEKVCGLARIMRSLVTPSFENMVTWQERDLTQSSAERFTIPESFVLIDYMLCLMTDIVTTLRVDEEAMERNLDLTKGRCMAESVMTQLVGKGMNRQEAHELLRKLAILSEAQNQPFKDVLLKNKVIVGRLSEEEIGKALTPSNYLGTAETQVALMIKKTREELKARVRA